MPYPISHRSLSNTILKITFLLLLYFLALGSAITKTTVPENQGSIVKVVQSGDTYHLECNGKPFFIKGAGGDGSKKLLHEMGGNSIRTWGVDNLQAILDDAQKQGLMVTAGIWLGHTEHGFNYNNSDQVADQMEMVRKAVLKFKDHPALLMWSLGNEMEGYDKGDNAAIWSAVNNLASMVKKIDRNHPVMTVIAEIGGDKVKNIHRLCPDIDIVGINSYGGGPTVAARYGQLGGQKPYILTEYGPPGIWETGKNSSNMTPELTSTEKADYYRKTYIGSIESQKKCLGSYAFTWGNKQEATSTWFGLLLPDGSRLGAVDTLSELWTGKIPANKCPQISTLKLLGKDQIEAGADVKAELQVSSPIGDSITVTWELRSDSSALNLNGDAEAVPRNYPEAIINPTSNQVQLHMPKYKGGYRLFAAARDMHGGAAAANVPIMVTSGEDLHAASRAVTKLPLILYDEAERSDLPFSPSGYMGNTGAIKMNLAYTSNPHTGKVCIQAQYNATDSWGGVVWMNPANDWGQKPGGYNLTGASRLSFWARGEKGGEALTFLCGVLGNDKPFSDSVQLKLESPVITKEWKQFSFDLNGKELTRLKCGFGWIAAAKGEAVTFYLDDIRID